MPIFPPPILSIPKNPIKTPINKATTEVLIGPGTHPISKPFLIDKYMFDRDLPEERENPLSSVEVGDDWMVGSLTRLACDPKAF